MFGCHESWLVVFVFLGWRCALVIRVSIDGLAGLQRQFGAMEKEMQKALVMGINKTAAKGKTEVKRAVSSVFVIKQKDVAPRIRIRRASAGRFEAVIDPFGLKKRGRALHLSQFIVGNKERYLRKKGVSPKNQRGIKVRVKRGGAAKTVAGAFLIRSKRSGKLMMMQREGKAQYPIRSLHTIDVPEMFGSRRVSQRVTSCIRRALPIEMERALAHVVRARR